MFKLKGKKIETPIKKVKKEVNTENKENKLESHVSFFSRKLRFFITLISHEQ